MNGEDIIKIPELESVLGEMADELQKNGELSEKIKRRFRDTYSSIFPENPDAPTTTVMSHYVKRYLNLI